MVLGSQPTAPTLGPPLQAREAWATAAGVALRGAVVTTDYNKMHYTVEGADPLGLAEVAASDASLGLQQYFERTHGLSAAWPDLPLLVCVPCRPLATRAATGEDNRPRLAAEFVSLRSAELRMPSALLAAAAAAYRELARRGGSPPGGKWSLDPPPTQLLTGGREAKLAALEVALGYRFADRSLRLLRQALRHSVADLELPSYERLEKVRPALCAVTSRGYVQCCCFRYGPLTPVAVVGSWATVCWSYP